MNTFELTERGLVVYHAWWTWATAVPERHRAMFKTPTLLSVHGYGAIFNYMMTFTVDVDPPPNVVPAAGAQALLGTPVFAAFLRLNATLLCPLELVRLAGAADEDTRGTSQGAVFLADEQLYSQILDQPCAIAVAYNNGTCVNASWDYGVYRPEARTVSGFTGNWVTELDLLLDEYAVGNTVGWIRDHPRSVLFFAGGTRFYYSEQTAPMRVFLAEFSKYLEDTGRTSISLDQLTAATAESAMTIREHMETVAQNYILV